MKKIILGTLILTLSAVLTGCGGETKEEYYGDGSLQYSAQYNANKQLDGSYISYWRNGKVEEKKNYSEGTLDGDFESFYEDGTHEVATNYSDGHVDGSFKEYSKDGKLKIERNYVDGSPEGEQKDYHKTGELYNANNYHDGVSHGEHTTYSKEGKILLKAYYEEGFFHGSYKIYLPDLSESIVATFKSGKLVDGYGYPMRMVKGFGYRRGKEVKGEKILLRNNSDFRKLMLKNGFINMFDKINGLSA